VAIIAQHSTTIATEPQIVWGLLVNPSAWQTWWADCVTASSGDQRQLQEGSKLELVVQPRQRKMTFHPEVDLLTEGKELSLTHRSALVQCTWSWRLQAQPAGTRVTLRGVFTGFAILTMGWLGQNDTARFSLHANLRGLKKIAERMA